MVHTTTQKYGYKSFTSTLILVGLLVLSSVVPAGAIDQSPNSDIPITQSQNDGQEITVSDITGQKQLIVTLETPSVGGNGDQESNELRKQVIADTQNAVLERNKSVINENTTVRYDQLPVLSTQGDDNAIASLEADPQVVSVQENKLRFLSLAESTSIIEATTVHSSGLDGSGTAIAILDTGVDSSHQFLNVISEACYSNAGGAAGGESLCPNGLNTQIGSGAGDHCTGVTGCNHGTHVAGIAAGDGDGAAFTGVAPGAGVISVQVFTEYNDAFCTFYFGYTPCLSATDSDVIAGMNRVLTLHNDPSFTPNIAAVNLSLGGGLYSSQSTCDSVASSYKSVIDVLRAAGIATVVASGNDGSSSQITAPGCVSSAIAVGSTTKADEVSSFSNSNSMVDLLAPGSTIRSSLPGGGFGYKSGTSMATPHVTGAVAIAKQSEDSADVATMTADITSSATTITDSRNSLSFGRINTNGFLGTLNTSSILVTTMDQYADETGNTARVQFSLDKRPSDEVTIPLDLTNVDEFSLNGVTEIVIIPDNWNDPSSNEVLVQGIDDNDPDGDQSTALITGSPTSTDSDFNTLTADDVEDVMLFNSDDDWPRLEIIWGDTNGDGVDEAFLVKYSSTGSGKIEIHQWNESQSAWASNNATNHNERPSGQVRVIFGDEDGDGKDSAYLIKYNETGSGTIEVHQWSSDYKSWVANRSTNHAVRTQLESRVVFGDMNGDSKDEPYFIKTMNTGSGKIEVHQWSSDYKSWVANRSTNHGQRPGSQVEVHFAKSVSPASDTAHLVKYTNNGSGKIEVHKWNDSLSGWISNHATNHSQRPPSQATVHPYSTTRNKSLSFNKYYNTGSSKIESHLWNDVFTQWLTNRSTNHNYLGNYSH